MIDFKVFCFHIDLGRQIERPEVLRGAVADMARRGYNTCMLYLEDAYQFGRHPAIARPHAYTPQFMRELHDLCAAQGIELIPAIPALAHCAYITSKPGYEKYDEGRGTEHNYGTLSPSYPETYELLTDLFRDWCDHVPGRYLQVGLDEAAAMGDYFKRTHGPEGFDPARMFADHANRLSAIAKSLGRRLIIGGDMFYYLPQAIDLIDRDIIILDWYYYHFEKTPKVEAFNFADIDLSGTMIQAGFEVWATSAIWPNMPFGDIADRWQVLRDWMRYGREKGITGIINCDWENATGFYSNADLLFRAFGSNLLRVRPRKIEKQLEETIEELTGLAESVDIVPDLMQLGRYHLTGHRNRRLFFRPLITRANQRRQEECREKFDSLSSMFPGLKDMIGRCPEPRGRQILMGIYLSWRFVTLVWKLGAILPDAYQKLCNVGRMKKRHLNVYGLFLALAGELEEFDSEYRQHWEEVRFADDRCPVHKWAAEAIADLRAWAAAIREVQPSDNPLAATPRLECVQECRHPALPVLMISALWPDGHKQTTNETMINFESPYSVPEITWRQYPSIPLERPELPAAIEIRSVNYGQAGVLEAGVMWRGKWYPYKLARIEGKHATQEDGVAWLGPVAQKVGDPLNRTDFDLAIYEKC